MPTQDETVTMPKPVSLGRRIGSAVFNLFGIAAMSVLGGCALIIFGLNH